MARHDCHSRCDLVGAVAWARGQIGCQAAHVHGQSGFGVSLSGSEPAPQLSPELGLRKQLSVVRGRRKGLEPQLAGSLVPNAPSGGVRTPRRFLSAVQLGNHCGTLSDELAATPLCTLKNTQT